MRLYVNVKTFLLVVFSTVTVVCLLYFYNKDGFSHQIPKANLQKAQVLLQLVGKNGLRSYRNSKDFVGLKLEDVPNMKVVEIDCHGLFANRSDTMKQAVKLQMHPKADLTDHQVKKLSMECDSYRSHRGYILQPVSAEEANFPLAVSLVVYKDAHLVERLLRAIYRPQNHYCIHIDTKARIDFRNAIVSVTNCFQNVFVSRTSVNVTWGEFSVLEANMVCLRELWMYKNWKYYINLSGQEFPLKTNGEIVKILKVFNGSNDALGSVHPTWLRQRMKKALFDPPPYGIRLGKGQLQVILTRAFVNFTLHNKVAIDFYDWIKDTFIPDESFFSSLNISPLLQIPGAYTGASHPAIEDQVSITRYIHWAYKERCPSKMPRDICILTVFHLPYLVQSVALFANKFHSGYHPLAYRCMEELIADRVRAEVIGMNDINLTYYRNLPYVLHHRN